jgi:hypothetical protein
MRNRAHLGDEKRQRGQGRDAKLDAMRPIGQDQALTDEPSDASTVRNETELLHTIGSRQLREAQTAAVRSRAN